MYSPNLREDVEQGQQMIGLIQLIIDLNNSATQDHLGNYKC